MVDPAKRFARRSWICHRIVDASPEDYLVPTRIPDCVMTDIGTFQRYFEQWFHSHHFDYADADEHRTPSNRVTILGSQFVDAQAGEEPERRDKVEVEVDHARVRRSGAGLRT